MKIFWDKKKGINEQGINEQSADVISRIPDLRDDRPYSEACAKICAFESVLAVKKEEFYRINYSPVIGQREILPGPEKDAQELLSGGNVENFVSSTVTDRKTSLRRQILAVEAALNVLKFKRDTIFGAAILRACEQMPIEAKHVFWAVIEAGQNLEDCIKAAIQADAILATKGLSDGYRDERFKVIPFWRNLLSNNAGLKTLTWVNIEQQKLWEEKET